MNRYIPLVQLRRSLLLAPLLVLLGGCSSLGVQPWERGTLAKPGMELNSQP